MWTLQYFGASTVEKPFSTTGAVTGWGISGQSPFEFHNTAKSTVHLMTTDDFDDAFQFAYGKKIIIWRDRTAVGSGGSIWFQGYVAQPERVAQGARRNQFLLHDWVWWAERIGFRQPCKLISGGTYASPTYTTEYADEVVLGETVLEVAQDVADQITEILTSLNQRFNPTGTIGVAGVPMPRNPMRCVVCYEAFRECMRQVPDAVMWTDYSTTPPTVHVTKLADMDTTTATLPSTDVTQAFTGLHLKPRYDRQLNGILISYKMPRTVGSDTQIGYSFDKYPAGADVDDPLVLSYIVELNGSRVTKTSTTVTTSVVNAANATAATRVDWWQAHDDRLKNARIVPGSLSVDLSSVTCVDAAGTAVSLASFPYELLSGSGGLLPGMNVSTKSVIITAKASWQRYHSTVDVKTEVETGQQIHARIVICDLDTGGVAEKFTTTTIEDTGESPPSGLAEYLYTAFTSLQHEGNISTAGQDIRGDVMPGKKLTITTPANSFPDNLIQSVSGEIFHGALTAQIGPPGVLSPSDVIEQLRVVRYVPNWKLPSGRSNGTSGGAPLTSLANASAKENTIPGFGEPSLATAAATFTP